MSAARRPKIYVLSTTPEIRLSTTDDNGNSVSPVLARLSIERPNGVVFTVSGGVMTDHTTYLSYTFTTASGVGPYMYEALVRDSGGREATDQHQFIIVDRITN